MSTISYNPNDVFIQLTLPNGNTSNITEDLPNIPNAIQIKYKEPRCESYAALDGSVYNVYNANQIGTVAITVFADSDTKIALNTVAASASQISLTISNKAQTGDLVVCTGLSLQDLGTQYYGGSSNERYRTYVLTGKIEVMI